MHNSSYSLMRYFINYIPKNPYILDVGGIDINGSYKTLFDPTYVYRTLDLKDADYTWENVPYNFFNVVILGQTFEHDKYFWKSLENIKKIVSSKGIVIIIVPSKGAYHKYPVDCYRFYPDSSIVFAEILNADILKVVWNSNLNATKWLIHPKDIAIYQRNTEWGDLGMVFKLK